MKKLIQILPLIILVVAVALLVIKITSDSKGGKGVNYFESRALGKQIPVLKLPTSVDAENGIYKDGYSLVNVFASWCTSCMYEHPLFAELSGLENLKLVGINWRDKRADSAAWLKKHGNPYDVIAYDELGKYGISLGIRGVPETFLVDPEGIVIDHVRGNIDEGFINKVKDIVK